MSTESTAQPAAFQVGRQHALQLLHQMIRIRRFEGKCAELYSATKIRGFLHLYDGEEAVAVGVMQALTPEDAIVATYRERGHALVRGIAAGAIMAEMYGKQEGCARGRGGSMHLFDAQTRFYGGNAIVGGGLPLAVGLALADKMQGQSRVTCCFFGDGAVAEGEFHESLNLAALWQLPRTHAPRHRRGHEPFEPRHPALLSGDTHRDEPCAALVGGREPEACHQRPSAARRAADQSGGAGAGRRPRAQRLLDRRPAPAPGSHTHRFRHLPPARWVGHPGHPSCGPQKPGRADGGAARPHPTGAGRPAAQLRIDRHHHHRDEPGRSGG